MKKILSAAAILLLLTIFLTAFVTLTYRTPGSATAKPPHTSINIQNSTSNTVTIGLSYYDASNNFQGGTSRTATAGSSVTDTQTFVAAKVIVSVISGSCTTLDFWNSTYTYDGGCVSNVGGVTGGTFYTGSNLSLVLLVNNTGCR